jgi:acyl carrier protein
VVFFEIPTEKIVLSSSLEDLGVESLLATELFSEMNKRFGLLISHADLALITDVQGLADLVSGSSLPQHHLQQLSLLLSVRQSPFVPRVKMICKPSYSLKEMGRPCPLIYIFPNGSSTSEKPS